MYVASVDAKLLRTPYAPHAREVHLPVSLSPRVRIHAQYADVPVATLSRGGAAST